jgi:hypothetical protein
MPPTERWPFNPSKPAAVDSFANCFSSASLGRRNVTFMSDRSAAFAVGR